MKCHKLQHKILIIKLFSVLMISFSVFSTDAKGTFIEDSGKYNLTNLYDSVISHYEDGKYSEAIFCLDKIVDIKDNLKKDAYPEYYKVYNRYGMIYKKIGILEKAVTFYEKTLEYPLTEEKYARVLMNIGNVFTQKGDFNSAIIYYNKVLSIILGLEEEQLLLANTYYNIGKAYDNTFQNELALKYFLLSEKTRDSARLPGDGETFINIATDYDKLDKKDTANIFFNKAIKLFERKYGRNHYSTALAYMHYAVFLADKGNYNRALQLYNKSLRILSNSFGNKHYSISYCYRKLGELYYQLKDYKKALSYFQQSLISNIYDFNDTSVYSNPSSKIVSNIDILEILTGKALAFGKLAIQENKETNLLAAFKTLELKVELIDQLRTGYLDENTKLKLLENEDDTYLILIRIAYKLYHKTKLEKYAKAAFKYSEKSKYSVLRELYNEESLMKSASIPDSLCQKQKRTREKLSEIRWQIENENNQIIPSKEKIIKLEEQLFQETQALESLSRKFENDYPEYVKLKYNNKVVDVKTMQSGLRDDQVAFEYAISDSTLYTFYISKNTFQVRDAQLDSNFYKNLNYYKKFLHSIISFNSYDSFRISTYYLYQTFLQPFEKEIIGKSLLIIPDEDFALISFESLIDEPYKEVDDANYAFEPYIIRKYPIGYAFSASLYVGCLNRRYKPKNKILAIAPDYKISGDSTLVLPFLAKYLRKLTFIGGKYYDKTDATETNLKREIANYNIIHIYAHGQDDVATQTKSSIILSNKNDTINDGFLYAYEVANLPLNAKLVVLASCYSGSGKISEGEGVMSIGRSFLSAGSSSLIISLWYNYLEVSTEQLGSFHKYLLLGKQKDVALQQAKLKYLENANSLTAHPKEWASLTLTGDQEPLYHMFIIKVMIIAVFCFILLFLTYRSAKWLIIKRKNKNIT
jgi:CHAT domain-containing protein